jgi:preprotein translocase subunit SecE
METKTRSASSELLSMMALVAGVVAAVILVFFGLGYLFGNLFL